MIKIALTAALVLGTASAALATEFDRQPRQPLSGLSPAPSAQSDAEGRNVALTGQVAVKTIDRAGANHDG